MKKLLLASLIAAMPSIAMADDVYGTWQTTKDDNGNFGHIEVSACGSKICGVLVKSFNPDGSPLKTDNIGKNIIWDMTNKGGGAYGGGKIWSPDRDKTYKSKMQMTGKTLKVKGCIGPICRNGGTWTKIN